MNEHWAAIAVAFMTLAGVVVSSYFGWRATYHAKKVNDAVNNRHPEAPTISDHVFELVATASRVEQRAGKTEAAIDRLEAEQIRQGVTIDDLSEWKSGYSGGPLDSGDKVLDFIAENKAAHAQVIEALAQLAEKVHCDCEEHENAE